MSEFAAVPEEVAEAIELMRFWAFTSGWSAGYGNAGGVPLVGLEARLRAAEAYNAEFGTDHMGEMLRGV